ncbi:MAG TPA: SRPBCC family protein [Roseiarcus sp.]|nr:SRPBCC family protein [Roseiarcus sp.]
MTRDEACATLAFDIAAPRQTVWEYLTVPGQWRKWWDADDIVQDSGKGRRGVGTKNHCMHGKAVNIEETLDWRPFDYFTAGITLPIPGAPRIVMTRALLDGPNGTTRLELRIAKPKPKDRAFVDGAAAKFAERMNKAIAGLRSVAEGNQPAVHALDEPMLKRSRGRFLAEPVGSGARR